MDQTPKYIVAARTAMAAASGKRGIGIFSKTEGGVAKWVYAAVLLGFPLGFIISVFPFWDSFGDLSAIKYLNSVVAPVIDPLPDDYRGETVAALHQRRFMIAAVAMAEGIFLSNIIALFFYNVRKRALLIWFASIVRRYLLISSVPD
jgi:hypothetical protein